MTDYELRRIIFQGATETTLFLIPVTQYNVRGNLKMNEGKGCLIQMGVEQLNTRNYLELCNEMIVLFGKKGFYNCVMKISRKDNSTEEELTFIGVNEANENRNIVRIILSFKPLKSRLQHHYCPFLLIYLH